MLIRSDFEPGPWGKFKCKQSHRDDLDAREAFEAVLRGDEVTPADAATTEVIASALDAKGNGTRAAMLRRVAGQVALPEAPSEAAPVVPGAPSAAPPPPDPPPPPVDPSQAAALAAAEAGRAIDQAGEDIPRLADLAYRAGLTPSPRWKADRLRLELQAVVAKNLAEGRAAFPG
jgi:hypothetical protein